MGHLLLGKHQGPQAGTAHETHRSHLDAQLGQGGQLQGREGFQQLGCRFGVHVSVQGDEVVTVLGDGFNGEVHGG
jgi:hypothetical protein